MPRELGQESCAGTGSPSARSLRASHLVASPCSCSITAAAQKVQEALKQAWQAGTIASLTSAALAARAPGAAAAAAGPAGMPAAAPRVDQTEQQREQQQQQHQPARAAATAAEPPRSACTPPPLLPDQRYGGEVVGARLKVYWPMEAEW